MSSVTKLAGLVAAILLGLVLGQLFGPINSLPSVVRVDEYYLEIVRNHTIFLGFCASLAACAINLRLRISPVSVMLTVVAVAAAWFIWFEAAEPDLITYLAGALVDFLGLVLIASALVVGIFWLIERKVRKGPDVRKV